VFYILVIENNVSLIDLTIITISDDLGNSVANVFRIKQPKHFTAAPVDKNARSRNNYLLKLNVKIIAGPPPAVENWYGQIVSED